MAIRNNVLGAVTLLASVASVSLAHADDGNCDGFQSLDPKVAIAIGKVDSNTDRVNFVKNRSTQNSCPSNDAACREKGYLVQGDQVIVSTIGENFVCADYVNSKGLTRAGWLPRSAIAIVPNQTSFRPEDWVGQWKGGPEQKISIEKTAKSNSDIKISGEATFGALDPARVKRGAVNLGEISATTVPDGGSLAFTMGDDKTLPYTQGDDYDCRVRMRLVGSFLLVEDNRNCGGMNVSFSGAYQRRK
ncbi:hypothetical protein [Microvirga alba]|uniref:Uncharacterized protein n=1 Tax=Microvirga alba TaxID=2791025 RepID=A0A931BRC1_9HYPH|nr:hypothetical protein [Microvirga alba]MBF9234264.1 hypothetical protein [Microvirga alba]